MCGLAARASLIARLAVAGVRAVRGSHISLSLSLALSLSCARARASPPFRRARRSNVVDKLRLIKDNKKKTEEKIDLLNERQTIKEDFIAKKTGARSLLALLKLKIESLAIVKEGELKELQEEFREIDSEFKELGVMAEREELFEGAKRGRGGEDPSKLNNDELLGRALDTQKKNKEMLKVRARGGGGACPRSPCAHDACAALGKPSLALASNTPSRSHHHTAQCALAPAGGLANGHRHQGDGDAHGRHAGAGPREDRRACCSAAGVCGARRLGDTRDAHFYF